MSDTLDLARLAEEAATRRLSMAQRKVLLSLPDNGAPRILNFRESISAHCLERVEIAPDVHVQLAEHSYMRGEGLRSQPIALLTGMGKRVAQSLRQGRHVLGEKA